MRFSLLLASTLFIPLHAFALGAACYSPSDCAGMEHCTSLDDGIIPGRCTTDARMIRAKPVKYIAPVSRAASSVGVMSSASTSRYSSAVVRSSSSLSHSNEASASAASSVMTEEEQDKLNAMFASMMQSMSSLSKSINSMFSSLGNSMKCIFGCAQ